MTQQEKRIKIAEACGWRKDYPCVDIDTEEPGFGWRAPKGSNHIDHPLDEGYLPDYFRDLNAMHDAENVALKEDILWSKYLLNISRQEDHQFGRFFSQVAASAPQRAEAFGKTLNLW